MRSAFFALLLLFAASVVSAADLFVECESFKTLGGWVVDPHSIPQLGSSYVMAHGYGKPVADCVTKARFYEPGTYMVWARTRDWTAVWHRGTPAGKFQIFVGEKALPEILGTNGEPWTWQKAGTVQITDENLNPEIRLHDLTGFNGRCDALYFTTDAAFTPPNDPQAMDAFRHAKTGITLKNAEESYDLIVVGGGMSGICSSMAAARLGLKVLLLQDRDVLGGCNSSEVRVSLGGRIHIAPYPMLGNLVYEIQPLHGSGGTYSAEFYEDARKEILFRRPNTGCRLLLREHVYALEMDPEHPKRIKAVLSRNTYTGAETRFTAPLFVDATGDAVLARMAGCEVMYGREARSKFNEINAPVEADRQVMGHSVLWYARKRETPAPFPDIDWAIPFDESSVYYIRGGDWEQEAGQYRDMAEETEYIRDYGLLSIFSNWNFVKNHSLRKAEFEYDELDWVSPIGGKRESYRTVGDHVLTQNDLENHVAYPDQTATITWDIDLHFPDPANEAKFGEPFRSCAYHRGFGEPYAVPYRCLYARDCENLFLAGRHISTSHVAFAAVRVMRTLGMLGEVVGMAAAICREHGAFPRDVYAQYLDELKEKMNAGVPLTPLYHTGSTGMHEAYHFKDLGWIRISPTPTPNLSDRVKSAIKAIGMVHRNEHPELRAKKDLPVIIVEAETHITPKETVENDLVLNCGQIFLEGGNLDLMQTIALTQGTRNTLNTAAQTTTSVYWPINSVPCDQEGGESCAHCHEKLDEKASGTLVKAGAGTLDLRGGVLNLGENLDVQAGTLILGGEKNENSEIRTGNIYLRPGATLKLNARNALGIWTFERRTLPAVLGIHSARVEAPSGTHVNLGPVEMASGTITSAPQDPGSPEIGNFCFAGKVTSYGKSEISAARISFRDDGASVNHESGTFDVPEAGDVLTISSALIPFRNGRLTKLGAGTLLLTGKWESAISLTVESGTVRVTGDAKIFNLKLGKDAVLILESPRSEILGKIEKEEGAEIRRGTN